MVSNSSLSTTTSDCLYSAPPQLASAAVGITISMASNSTALMTPPSHGCPCSPSSLSSTVGSPIILHHTPLKSRDIGEDMEQIRLSRQDNPYLQRVAGSQASLIDDEVMNIGALDDDEDTTQLVSPSDMSDESLSISEVHEHLIRSPPPTSVPKTLTGQTLFVFDTDTVNDIPNVPMSARRDILNPVHSKHHDVICDHQMKEILDDQRKLSGQTKEGTLLSTNAPLSPFRSTMGLASYRHQRTFSENCPVTSNPDSQTQISLAPVQPPRKKHSVPNEVFLNRPLINSQRLAVNSDKHFRRTSSLRGTVCSQVTTGTTSSLNLPIRCPHQPSGQLA